MIEEKMNKLKEKYLGEDEEEVVDEEAFQKKDFDVFVKTENLVLLKDTNSDEIFVVQKDINGMARLFPLKIKW